MSINLTKGARINLSKAAPSLTVVKLGLGWNANKFTGASFDLDASAFILKTDAEGNNKLVSDKHFVFYGNFSDPTKSVVHSGDNLTGDGDGDDEVITVDLTKLPDEVTEVSLVVNIYQAQSRKQNFGMVTNSYVRLFDTNNTEIAKYCLEDEFSTETSVQFGSLYKKDGQWLFKAVGQGFDKGLDEFIVAYGGKLAA